MTPTASRVLRVALLSTVATTALAPMASAQDIPFEANSIFLGTIDFGSQDLDGDDLSAQDIVDANPEDLAELFKAEPTLLVGGGLPATQKLYVRGVEENNLAITIDGSRQNNKVFHHTATTLIDPELLKAVRVDPGVAPADAGPGGLAGSIAYETKDAMDLLEPGESTGGSTKFGFDTNGSTLTTSATVFGKTGGFDYLAYFKNAEGGNRKDGNGVEINGSETALKSGLVKLAYQADSGDRFELSYEAVEDKAERPYRANISEFQTNETRLYDIDRSNIVFTYSDESPEGLWNPTIVIARSQSDVYTGEADFRGTGEFSARNTSFNGKIENEFSLAMGSVVAGADFFNDSIIREPGLASELTETIKNRGIYAQARLEPLDGLNLSFGGRYDSQTFEGFDGTTYSESGFSGNAAIEFDLSDTLTLKAGYSKTFAGWSLAEGYILNDDEGGSGFIYPGSIPTGEGENWFVGGTAFLGNVELEATYFKSSLSDVRLAGWSYPDQLMSMNAEGYELSAAISWNAGSAKLGFANVDSDVSSSVDGGPFNESYYGNYMTMPIGKVVSLSLDHAMDNGWRLGGDIQHALDHASDVDTIAGYTVVNAFAEFQPAQFDGALTIRAEVNNLFDETYANRGTYGEDYATFGFTPQYEPGRSFALTARFDF